ncbi:molybdate ABC transporter substrate-binding protein [Vibrio mediterranei]|uniref:molybdate ABC transporter substrate-binding protein n=1 Tax=Vibrio mediterranei TaxID=689 RepID=UPI0022846881|nr:molybdate ABC transporter substrate-binding protein [Vibrio mediterranei]MCY9853803.1 molybdate ABC transporter substrate-binding protein [Vibrio mediterranei]
MKKLLILLFVTLSPETLAATLNIYAASSMTNAVDELASEFNQQSNVDVVKIYGGSSSIARQIYQGAPADLFISANVKWVDYLIKKGTVEAENVSNIAQNRLVLIKNNAVTHKSAFVFDSAKSWDQWLNGERLAIGTVSSVPAGIYAKQSLESLNVWASVRSHLAPVNNVRQVLALVERNEAPLGIVYKTDAMASDSVDVIGAFPDTTHDPIIYPLVKLNSRHETQEFVEFIQSQSGQQILAKYGFSPLDGNQ